MDNLTMAGLQGTEGGSKGAALLSGMSAGSIIAAVLFSLVGLVYLKQGREQADVTRIVCGIALMAYTFFVSGTLYTVLVGVLLTAAPFILDRF